jgi:hypothetical protein
MSVVQPLQGNDNSSTRSWQPNAKIAPSKGWNSTYAVHYRNPAKRLSRNHEYWLKRASERAEATAQLAHQGLALQPRNHTFRDPSLNLAFNQPLRNPSSTARDLVPNSPFGYTMPATLTARPLASSLRDTGRRSHDQFDQHLYQQHYGAPYGVSALAVLEGQAAGAFGTIPNQATARPHVERVYNARAPPVANGFHVPRGGYGSTARPQSAHPALGQSLTYRQPEGGLQANGLYATLSPQQAWTESPASPQRQHQSPLARTTNGSYVRPEARLPAGYTQRVSDASPKAVLSRSQTFRPQLSASGSAPLLPANAMLDVSPAATVKQQQRQFQPQQNGAYQELQL